MPYVSEHLFRERLPQDASHTNHAVVLISPHQFFETRGGAIFAFRRAMRCISLTCDPLVGPEVDLGEAVDEFDATFESDAAVFAGVSGVLARALAERGYSVLKMGEEPWVDLAAFEPKGNRGKGVRAARNQALRAGCVAEEWDETRFRERRPEVEAVFQEWRGLTLVSLEGGILATAPFAEIPGRRYFVASCQGRIEAVLVATPVKAGVTYYLEDLVYRRKSVRGVQELLMLAAMEGLRQSGVQSVNLGLVLLRKMERMGESTYSARSITARLLGTAISLAYNAKGQDLFRKRFPVAVWEPAYLAFRGPRRMFGRVTRWFPAAALIWSLLAMLADLEPTFIWPWF